MFKRTVNLPDNFAVPSKKDIHGHRSLMDSLRTFPEFAQYNISNRCPNEKVMKGLRVVDKAWNPEEEKKLGTIVKESGKEVDVQWDKPGPVATSLKLSELRLFDNGGTGVLHNNVACKECNTYPLRGLRWKCLNCDDYDLCTFCYMADAHNLRHVFLRFKRNDSKGVEIPPRLPLKGTGYAFACGILKNAVVNLRKNTRKKGEVLEIGVANGIDVEWQKTKSDTMTSYKTSRHNILDLQYENPILFPFYPDHLPVLQKGDTFDHLDVKFSEEHTAQKVQLNIRRMNSDDQKGSHKPVLYLIFDNYQENNQEQKDTFAVMDEIFEYSKRTKLPCHVVNQRVLFLHGSTTTVCIHSKTSKETIEELLRKGCLIFERADKEKKTDEIDYFIKMATSVLGENVIPVKIPLRHVKRISEPSLPVPSVQFEKTSQDVRFLAPQKAKEEQSQYSTTLKSPWMATKSEKKKQKEKEKDDATTKTDNVELIASVKDVQSTLDFEALICYVSIGVSMTNEIHGMDKELYSDALAMYLLKNGKWRIPKDAFKTSFRYSCIKYIYEKDLTTAFANGLKADLEKMTTSYHASKHLSELEIQQAVTNSDVVGLIFLALLRNQFYTGAIQLVDTGFVCIRHILVGCQILQDASDDKRNEQIQRETSQRLKLYFTERANLIIRFINEATSKNEVVDDEIAETVNHAGRLLLNHGYLEDAIKTENKTFLENETVTYILNKMWYGKEKSLFRQVGLYILLTLLHLLVMPLLMVNINARPLRRVYQKYNLPFMKALIQMLGYLALLLTYSYMLLFKLNESLSYTDFLIIGWMISFCINETKQFKDTFVFLIILTVILVSYNVSFHSLLYPNSELSWSEIEKVMQHGYWMLFGEINLEEDTLTDCTFNKTMYTSGALRRCPTSLGLHFSPYLKALYELIAVILLLNLLIAIYSDTYQKVNDECKFHWSQLQTDFLEEYSVQTIFPIHLQLLALPFCLVHFFIWCAKYCCFKIKERRLNKIQNGKNHFSSNSYDLQMEKRKENPMFVRVFLYNANFDLRLKSTEEAERNGAIKSKGKIEITEEDKITKLQKQIDDTKKTFEEHLNRNDEMLKIILENVKEIKSKIQGECQDIERQTESTYFQK